MSAWNLRAEKAQVPTPIESAKPVNTTDVPIVAKDSTSASSSDLPSRMRSMSAEQR